MTEKLKGVIALTTATFFGGAILPSIIRTGVSTIDPLIFTFFRTSLSAIILLTIIRNQLPQISKNYRRYLPATFLLGLTLAGNLTLFAQGVSYTTLIVSQLMYTILPITTGIVSFFWLKEKMPAQKILGALIAIFGVSILVIFSGQSSQRLSLGTLNGNLLILSAVLCYTMYFIFSKKYSRLYDPLLISALSATGATIVSLPLALIYMTRFNFSQVSLESWTSAVAIGIVSTIFYFLVQYGIKRLSTVSGATITQLSPEFAALTGVFFYHEKISLMLILSLILVSGGAFLSVQTEQQSWWQKLISKFKAGR